MSLKNEEGMTLVMVIILIVVGSILVTTLLAAVRTHMNTAVHEESMSQAFYAADSGVELVRGNSKEIFEKFDEAEDNFYLEEKNNELNFHDINSKDNIPWFNFGDEVKFSIKVLDSEEIIFLSKGKHTINEKILKEIEFKLVPVPSFVNTFNLTDRTEEYDYEDHFSLLGGSYEDQIHLTSWPDFDEDENFWEPYFDEELNFDEHFENGDDYTIDEGIYEEYRLYDNSLDINLQGTNEKIQDSIIIVDGHININMSDKEEIKNSIIIVKDYILVEGTATINDTLLLIYGDEIYDHGSHTGFLTDAGAEATIIISEVLPKPGFDEFIITELGEGEIGDLALEHWQQK